MQYIPRDILEQVKGSVQNALHSLQTEAGAKILPPAIHSRMIENHVIGMITTLTGSSTLPHDMRDISHPIFNEVRGGHDLEDK